MRFAVGVALLLAAGAVVLSITSPDPFGSFGCALAGLVPIGPWCMELALAAALAAILALVGIVALVSSRGGR